MHRVIERSAATPALLDGDDGSAVAAWALRRGETVTCWWSDSLVFNARVSAWLAEAVENGLPYAVLTFRELAERPPVS